MDFILILLAVMTWFFVSIAIAARSMSLFGLKNAPSRRRAVIWVLLFLAVLCAPFFDDMYGRYNVKRLCDSQGGLKVFKTVENVEGVQLAGADEITLRAMGYRFVESVSEKFGGSYQLPPTRYSLDVSGRVLIEKNITPRARYAYQRRDTGLGNHIRQQDQLIMDLQVNEVLARNTNFLFPGGWFLRYVHGGYGGGPGADCGFAGVIDSEFLATVLNPAR
jgi:hypothetical protein